MRYFNFKNILLILFYIPFNVIITTDNKLYDFATKSLGIDCIECNISDAEIVKKLKSNGVLNQINIDELKQLYILELKYRVVQIICMDEDFSINNSLNAMLLHALSTILIISKNEHDAIFQWHKLKKEKEEIFSSKIMQQLLDLNGSDIVSLYLHTQNYIRNHRFDILYDVIIRIVNVHQWNDQYELNQNEHIARSLHNLQEKGLLIQFDLDKISVLKDLLYKSSSKPIVEHIKNEKLLIINGFRQSKTALMIHDSFDHFWTYNLLENAEILKRYAVFLQKVGNPHTTDIFCREGELIASVAFDFRFACLSDKLDSFFTLDQIKEFFYNASELTCNQEKALAIITNKNKNSVFIKRLLHVVSGVVTELMEQRRKHGYVRLLGNDQNSAILCALDLEYLALIIEVYDCLDANKDKAFHALSNIVLILENYLLNFVLNKQEQQELVLTLNDIDNFNVHECNLSQERISYLKNHLATLSNRSHMKIEFEAKFFPINKAIFRKVLLSVGATLQQKELRMRRVIYELGDGSTRKWLRIRDEGQNTTMTTKEIIDPQAIDGIREIELKTDDFKKTWDFYDSLGLQFCSYQENDREIWELDDATITIDTWPGLEPILEIEGESADHVKSVVDKLHLDFEDAHFGAVDKIYYDVYQISTQDLNSIKNLSFDTIQQALHLLRKTSAS